MTIYQEYDYVVIIISSQEPYTPTFRKMCFFVDYGLIGHTNQNHRVWWCFLP